MKFTLGKGERLKSRKLIERLFKEGSSVKVYPFKLIYLRTSHTSDFPVQASFSVPKRKFKKAVERNRIKRLLRETYRLDKHIVYETVTDSFIFMITFIGKEEPTFIDAKKSMNKLLHLFVKEVEEI